MAKSFNNGMTNGQTLYLDLEYAENQRKNKINHHFSSYSFYLFVLSFTLTILVAIPQLFTMMMIIIVIGLQRLYSDRFHLREKLFGLGLVFASNVFDHLQFGLIILPGFITNDIITGGVWVLEVIWVIFFGLEALYSFSLETGHNASGNVTPATENSNRAFLKFKSRLAGTRFEIGDFSEQPDISLLESSYRRVVIYMVGILVMIVLIDTILWRVIDNLSGGQNVKEAYFVSGMSLILFILLLSSGSFLFPSENEK